VTWMTFLAPTRHPRGDTKVGSCVNETDYFEPAWQEGLWGVNYPRLRDIKQR